MTREGVIIDLRDPEELAWLSRARERRGTCTVEYTHSDDEFDPRQRVLERYRETLGELLASEFPLDEFNLNSSARETLVKALMTLQAVDEYRSTDDSIPANKSFESFGVRRETISRAIIENNDGLLESLFNPGRDIPEIESLVESMIVDELGRYQRPQSAHSVGREIAHEVTEYRYEELCASLTVELLEDGVNPQQVFRHRQREVANMIVEEHSNFDLFSRYFETAYGPTSTTETAIQDLEASPLDPQTMRDHYRETIGHPPPSLGGAGTRAGAAGMSDAESVPSDTDEDPAFSDDGDESKELSDLRPVADAPERENRRLYLIHAATEHRRAIVREVLLESTDDSVSTETDISGCLFPVRRSQVGALDSMRQDDHLLFYTNDGQYGVQAVVGTATIAPDIGELLWNDDDSVSRPYVIEAKNVKRVNIDAGELSRRLGYNREYPTGIQPVAPVRLDSVRASYGSIQSFLSTLQALDQGETTAEFEVDVIIDAKDCILGRVASEVAQQALDGNRVAVVNAEGAVITGDPKSTTETYRQRADLGSESGPYYPKRPDSIFKRTIRGMLPYKTVHGREAFENVRVYLGNPYDEDGEVLEATSLDQISNIKFISLGELSEKLGANVTW
jgi:large subunit ribosomal protein L13